ncbi:hypothetical protein KR093_010780, partial [Drosophila rubida]
IRYSNFKPYDKECCHNIKTNHTKIYGCGGTHARGSSKVKLKNVVDYKWEHKYYYPGHLVAVHRDGKHLAYAINGELLTNAMITVLLNRYDCLFHVVNNKATGMEGMVRVCNTNTSQRALIKGMNGEVLDLQFAHSERDRILAVIDVSSMFVYKIDLIDGSLMCKLVLKVDDPIANYSPEFDMVSWCPYITNSHSSNNAIISASGEEEDENQLLLWSRSSQFQCFHVRMIVSEHGRGQIQPTALETGYLKIEEDSLITCAALSPDGTTVAAACDDGVVRFYQIYLFDVRNHRCLHEWKPHDGKRVSSLFFLDNINKPADDAYWQYVITTSDYNTEIKLWNCSLWECLQTVNIIATIPSAVHPCKFIAGIDRSAGYLVISSIDSLAVYVMQIKNAAALNSSLNDQASDSGDSNNGNVAVSGSAGNKEARIQNVAEFKLSSGILSFSIVDASMRQLKSTNESYYQFEEPDDYDDDENNATTDALVVHMFVVQGKSLQECQIIYQPCAAEKPERSLNSSNNTSSTTSNKRSLTPEDANTARLLLSGDIKQEPSSPLNSSGGSSGVPLDALFAKSKRNSGSCTTTSSVVAVAVAAAAAPSAILQEPLSATSSNKSRSASPFSNLLNLMTPDAFSATSSSTTTAVLLATSSSSGSSNTTGTDAINTTAAVAAAANADQSEINSHVLSTLRMLATVNAKGTDISNANLLNLMNNTLIEDREHQKLKEKLEARKKFIAIDRNPERNVAENLASGGSSPSREVQEIMATQEDADADDYEPELDNLESDEENNYYMLCKKEEELANASPSLLQVVEETAANWLPDASSSKLQSAPTKKSAELQNAAQIMSQAVQHKNNGNVPPTLGGSNSSANSSSNNNTSSTLNSSNNSSHNATIENAAGNAEMNVKLEQLLDLVKAQSQQLNKLEHEVSKLQQQQQQQQQPGNSSSVSKTAVLQPKTVNELAYKIEMQLCKLMEQYLKRYENEHKRRLAEFLHERESQNRVMRDSMMQGFNQYVMKHFTDIIGNVLNMELQRHILPCVSAKMDQLQNQMQLEMVQKLSVFDKTVKENISQVCKSKQFLDAFGKSVLIGVQTSLQTAFIESMSSTLIPAYEKSSQSMFKQLHDAFSVGIKDFMVEFSAYLQHMPQPHGEELSNKLGLLKQMVETNLLKHRSELTDAMLETQREVKSLEILLARQVQETIRAELRKYLDGQNMVMRSQAATPAPTYDMRDSIKQLLQAGQINKAFHQALLANDLNLVEFTLCHTDRMQVFAPEGCRLEQKVLLSLIQQISADMSNHNELKQSYLNEALLAINMSDPITREHAPKVLSELHRNCRMFIKNYPKSPQCSNVRLLIAMYTATYRDQFK